MPLYHAVVYGVIQGLTEFLPVSSSAHLVLWPWFTGWPDPGLAFNVALHWGTLIAVLVYFRQDIVRLAIDFFCSLKGQWTPETKLPWQIGAATVPGALGGLLFEQQAETLFRSPLIIAGTLTGLGLLLLVADRVGKNRIPLGQITWAHAIAIGVSQALAIVPGVSRSGITISLALLLGLDRTAAVRFSFYLSIPIILGAGLLKVEYIVQNMNNLFFWVGMIASTVSGMSAIHFLLRYVRNRSFAPFVAYRFGLAGLIVVYLARIAEK